MSKKFQRKIEDFVCENCGTEVSGNGYTNHCPKCLFSKHVDNFPGDRENDCGGLMESIDVEVRGDEKIITFRCQKCGEIRKTKSVSKDDEKKILEIIKNKAENFWKK